MKKNSYLIIFVLFCISFITFTFVFKYILDYLLLNLLNLNKYQLAPFIIKLISMLISMNTSIKLIFKNFYIERNSVDKIIKLIKIFIILYSLILVLIYGMNDISSIYNIITYLIFSIISISFANEFIKGYASKIV